MRIGVIGTGLMGSNLARCLSRKKVNVGLYNRTREKAEKLAAEIGAPVYGSPVDLVRNYESVIVFVSDDQALLDVSLRIASGAPYPDQRIFINASTVTPMASLRARDILEAKGVAYVEAPVYGSTDEARECKLISILACREQNAEKASQVANLYSIEIMYVGEPPKALALKLALNNVGLALPAILAESLMILSAWGVEHGTFLEVARKLWFGNLLERYWQRITEEKPPRFKLIMAGKDYWYIASTLAAKGLPSLISSAMYSMYFAAATGGYAEKDYPQVARFFMELARKSFDRSRSETPA